MHAQEYSRRGWEEGKKSFEYRGKTLSIIIRREKNIENAKSEKFSSLKEKHYDST